MAVKTTIGSPIQTLSPRLTFTLSTVDWVGAKIVALLSVSCSLLSIVFSSKGKITVNSFFPSYI